MNPPIHIQHVVLSLRPGGLENGVVNVVNGLDKTRFRSSVCCLKEAGEFAARIAQPGVDVHELGSRGGIDMALPFRLAKLFKTSRTDIVHTRNAEAFYYGALGAKLAGIPCVVHSEHGRTFLDRPIRWRLQRFLTLFTDAVFAVSGQLRSDLVRNIGIPASKIEVLHNGVDFARFGSSQSREALHAEWRVAPEHTVVGSVGRLVAVKNYPLLLKAAAGISNICVVLVGDGPERAPLENLASELGISDRVHLLGHRDDVSSLLGAFDIFVLPSFSEGMSNTLLEAMAAGVPPVVTDVGGNPEIVRDGVEGLLFQSGDAQALQKRLEALLADSALQKRFATASHDRVRTSFGINAMVCRYDDLYSRVISARRGA